jgi:cellulose synthase (UDP-forming)
MTPSLILHLWRERWGKAEQSNPNKPYLLDSVYQWGIKIPTSNVFAIPGVSLATLAVFAAFAFFVANLRFTLNGQISFSGLMICAALLLRRYAGPFFTLCLIGLTLLCLTQYFNWRFGQSLQNQFVLEFVWAFSLAALELVVASYFALGWISKLSPIREFAIAMPENQDQWPSVNLVLLSDAMRDDSASYEQTQEIKTRLSLLDWPEKKFLVSACLIASGDSNQRFIQIDQLINQSQHDLILFIEPSALNQTKLWHWLDSKHFLERISAWFSRDSGLAFLYGKNGFLGEQFTQSQNSITRDFDAHSFPVSMVRTIAWRQMGSISATKKIDLLMSKSSYLIAEKQSDAFVFSKVDRANSALVQGLKKAIVKFRNVLLFYRSIAAIAFFTTPLALLIFGTQLVSTQFESFLSLAIPAVLLFSITNSRTNIYSRWSSWRQFKESILALYFLVLTPFKFITTVFKKPSLVIRRWWFQMSYRQLAIESVVALFFMGNLIGALHSISFFFVYESSASHWRVFYVAWAAFNCLLLLSRQAIEHERAHIVWFAKHRSTLDGTIRLPMGRTVVCKTTNFPSQHLGLQLPIDIQMQYGLSVGHAITLSFLHANQYFHWQAQIQSIQGHHVVVNTSPTQTGFTQLRQLLLARGTDWPAWLPSKNADRPFPEWLYSFVESLPAKMIDWSARAMGLLSWNSIGRLWKTKK